MRETPADLRPKIAAGWLAAILAVSLLLRVGFPNVDPDRAFGTDYLTDEGFYAKNARLLVETGHWLRPGDNHNHVFLAPLHVAVNASAFALFGVSLATALATARAVSVAAGMALIALLFAALRRAAGFRTALLGAAFAAVDPALVHLSRVALVEGTLALATAVVFVAFAGGPLDRWRSLVVGAAWTMAFLVKGSAVAILPGLAIAWLFFGLMERRPWAALAQLGGCLTVCAVVVLGFRATARTLAGTIFEHAAAIHLGDLSPARLGAALLDAAATKTALVGLQRSPVVAILVLTSVLGLFAVARRSDVRTRALFAAALGWFAGQLLFFSALPYQPWRYFLSLGAPAAILAALVLHQVAIRWASLVSLVVASLAVAVAAMHTITPMIGGERTD